MTTTAPAPAELDPEWVSCLSCKDLIYGKRYARDLRVCSGCGAHGRLTAWQRVDQLFDPGSVVPLPVPAAVDDPLEFVAVKPYRQSLADARRRTGLDDAVISVRGTVQGRALIGAVMDFRFLGGSMGCAVGEHLTVAMETALRERLPLLLVTSSGGARMQEGALSLMQMAKTSQAMAELDEAGLLTITLICDPTYGGVAASFATLADVVIAEAGAHLGFAGPRVIEQTIRQQLPEGFQTAEFLLAHGLVDDVVPRSRVRDVLSRLLAVARPGIPAVPAESAELITAPADLPVRDPWDAVQEARHTGRPTTLDHLGFLVEEFHELHGDRISADCPAIVAGVGRLDGLPIILIGHQKGHGTKERMARNFGMATPAGYRKAARVMRLAAKLGLPIVTLIDTPGAYPGVEAEANGQAVAIAENLRLMSGLPVPVVAVVIGEGGSGGALALGVADRVLALQNAVYSVISPEGCAAILWKDAAAAPRAAAALRIDARELLGRAVVDGVVREPAGGAHRDPAAAAELLRRALAATLYELATEDPGSLVANRRRRYRAFGAVRPRAAVS